ncbi:MAG: DUF362 domain-containing protein [Anaerolineae bacterium]|nr:DUF362 domain-containing protein [Anaerolineae bacterium]
MSSQITPRRSLEGLKMFLVRQRWEQPDVSLENISGYIQGALERKGILKLIRPGDSIAITAGSRGIGTIPHVLRAIVDAVRARGGKPFLFPAMGSHGGGTAEGQKELLAGLGITEEAMGAPILATMEVVQIGETEEGVPVYLDAFAARADGIIVVNRVKKHTNFDAPIESGLCKMAVIGMGKHAQAVVVHQLGNAAFREHIPKIARIVFSRAPVLGGLALLENAWGGLAEAVPLLPEEIIEQEPSLLQRAKSYSAKIPFPEIDILLVERMGKDISGTGMDCYVIGRKRIIGEPEWSEAPQIHSLVLLDLTDASHGNAVGVGLADFTTRRLVSKIDWKATYVNVLTSGNLERGKLPLVFETDREALEAAAFRERKVPLQELRLLCIPDTLHLRYLFVSEALAEQAKGQGKLEILSGPHRLPFDKGGNWISPFEEKGP